MCADVSISRNDAADLAASFEHCRRVTRSQAGNFYYGLCLLPTAKRAALYVLYAWMRRIDDLADSAADMGVKRRQLAAFRDQTLAVVGSRGSAMMESSPDGASADHDDILIWPALGNVVGRYQIAVSVLRDMIAGQLMDQEKTRYADFDQLYDYCYKVAGTVGLACLAVWGSDGGAATLEMAKHRGIALQLTNILRDLVEDARRDRLYLPADELAAFSLTADELLAQIVSGGVDDRFDMLMRSQIDRARRYYESSATLERCLSPDSRAACAAIGGIYRALLEKIAANPRQVLAARVRIGKARKISIAVKAVLTRRI